MEVEVEDGVPGGSLRDEVEDDADDGACPGVDEEDKKRKKRRRRKKGKGASERALRLFLQNIALKKAAAAEAISDDGLQ